MNISGTSTIFGKSGPFAQFVQPLSKEAVDAFASVIAGHSTPADAAKTPASAENAASGSQASNSQPQGKLERALEHAVNYVQDHFGDNAARVVMGLVVAKTGGQNVTEESLGEGLVDGLEFIDRTFGTKAGDKAIAFFNGELNKTINDYFQNGQNEEFGVKTVSGAQAALGQATAKATAELQDALAANAGDTSLTDLLPEPGEEAEAAGTADDAEAGTTTEAAADTAATTDATATDASSTDTATDAAADTSGADASTTSTATQAAGHHHHHIRRRRGHRSKQLAGYAPRDLQRGVAVNASA
ncbi:hypothetical protein [Fundidesulfovibrio agrisoli]|uniref:hypothetical protein n=1 Tax=Fundidesulfovibrio agrisoli TaxID=2922717 RepID=UPI001FAB74A0|nr:hypothetical protein [Fundidesulfovibrio agrisoli]